MSDDKKLSELPGAGAPQDTDSFYLARAGASLGATWAAIKAAVVSLIPSAANPSGSVGIAAANGAAATYMRSDAAPPISQAIAPTWTGKHIFQKTGVANSLPTEVLVIQELTTASSGNEFLSPPARLKGSGWRGSAQTVEFRYYVTPVDNGSGANGYFVMESNIGGAGWVEVWRIDDTGAGVINGLQVISGMSALFNPNGLGISGNNGNGSISFLLDDSAWISGTQRNFSLTIPDADTALVMDGNNSFPTLKASSVGGYKSSDGSAGFTGTVTTGSLVGKTITIKDGLITGFA